VDPPVKLPGVAEALTATAFVLIVVAAIVWALVAVKVWH
jgi:hypothetical protein